MGSLPVRSYFSFGSNIASGLMLPATASPVLLLLSLVSCSAATTVPGASPFLVLSMPSGISASQKSLPVSVNLACVPSLSAMASLLAGKTVKLKGAREKCSCSRPSTTRGDGSGRGPVGPAL